MSPEYNARNGVATGLDYQTEHISPDVLNRSMIRWEYSAEFFPSFFSTPFVYRNWFGCYLGIN